jgi:DNA-binding XRE family transcriptional regulator
VDDGIPDLRFILSTLREATDSLGRLLGERSGRAAPEEPHLVCVDNLTSGAEDAPMDKEEFRRLRHASGMTQESAAACLEVSHRTVVRWEKGDASIDPLRAQAIRLRLARRIDGENGRRRRVMSN